MDMDVVVTAQRPGAGSGRAGGSRPYPPASFHACMAVITASKMVAPSLNERAVMRKFKGNAAGKSEESKMDLKNKDDERQNYWNDDLITPDRK
jgi:hypothetical protein